MRDPLDGIPPPPETGDLRQEAVRFGRYLVGRTPAPQLVDRYVDAVRRLELQPDARDRRALAFVTRHPRALGFVDAGLALRRPASTVRARLLVMAAIVEAAPDHADLELHPAALWRAAVVAGVAGGRAGLRAMVGVALVTFL